MLKTTRVYFGVLHIFFPQNYKDSKIEEFFRLEQKNMLVSEYEKRFSEIVRLVLYIQGGVSRAEGPMQLQV